MPHSSRSTGPGRLRELPPPLEHVRALHVAEEVARRDRERTVIDPLVRVADFHGELRELHERGGLRRVGHPIELANALLERGAQVRDERFHLRLRRRWEVLLDVQPADRLAELRAHELHRARRARQLRGLVVEHGAEEREVRVGELGCQLRRERVQVLKAQIRLPDVKRRAAEHLGELRERALLIGDEPVLLRQLAGFQERVPWKSWRERDELGAIDGIVGLVRVAPIGVRPRHVGDPGTPHSRSALLSLSHSNGVPPGSPIRTRLPSCACSARRVPSPSAEMRGTASWPGRPHAQVLRNHSVGSTCRDAGSGSAVLHA